MRVHVALGVTDLPSAVDDYTRLLGREPELVIPDAYALFRTRELNLSLRVTAGEAGQVRHLGFELDEPTPFEAISGIPCTNLRSFRRGRRRVSRGGGFRATATHAERAALQAAGP